MLLSKVASRRHARIGPALLFVPLALLGLMLTLTVSDSRAASAGDVTHPSLVGEVPRLDTPKVLEGWVYANIQLHDRVIVAGEFTQVERSDGTIAARNNIMAYDINTGALIEDFAPNINNTIWALKAGEDPGVFYAGGAFSNVDGTPRYRIAKFDYFGDLDPTFAAVIDAKVMAIEVADGNVFIGGSFETIDGERHARIAALDKTTGDLIPEFRIQSEGVAGKDGYNSVKALDLHPDGNRLLVVHNSFELVDHNGPKGHLNTAATIIDIRNFTVTDWYTRWYELNGDRCGANGGLTIRDGEFSPDGSMFVIVEKGDFRCDKIVAFNTAIANDPQGNPAKWVTAGHDSVYSVGITDKAVYIGGHFCLLRDYGPMTAAVNATFDWQEKPTDCVTGGNTSFGEFDARYQIAALDLATGEPLDWDPRSNALQAVFDIEPIERGLLIGQDRDRINQRRTGLHAFIDFGGVTPPFMPPVDVEPECSAVARTDGSVRLTWNALPGTSYQSILRDGNWVATYEDAITETHVDVPGAGSYTYTLRIKVRGLAVANYSCQPNPVIVGAGAGPECSAVVRADGVVKLTWTALPGTSYQSVLRDGTWIATYEDAITEVHRDFTPGVGAHTYSLRIKVRGQALAEYTCQPDPVIVGANFPCTVTQTGADSSLSWDAVAGINEYQVRRDGSWVAGTAGTAYVDAGQIAADHTWIIRYRSGGVNTDITCTLV